MIIKYHFKANELLRRISPEEMGLEYTSVQRMELTASLTLNTNLTLDTKDEEICLVVMGGEVDFQYGRFTGTAIFKDMIYIPWKESITLIPKTRTVLMRFGAPSHIDTQFAHLKFSDVDQDPKKHKVFGKVENNCQRDVWNFIDDDFKASRLMVGLCEGNIGGWTSWPPHEHADKREEVYVYFNMGKAFGIQCVYKDMEHPLIVAIVKDGDLISIPRGYHPNVGCPGGKISFIYCMVAKKPGDRKFMDLHIQKIFGDKLE